MSAPTPPPSLAHFIAYALHRTRLTSSVTTNAGVRFTASCLKTKCTLPNSSKRKSYLHCPRIPCSPGVHRFNTLLFPLRRPRPARRQCSTARFRLSLATPTSGLPLWMWTPSPRPLVPPFLTSENHSPMRRLSTVLPISRRPALVKPTDVLRGVCQLVDVLRPASTMRNWQDTSKAYP